MHRRRVGLLRAAGDFGQPRPAGEASRQPEEARGQRRIEAAIAAGCTQISTETGEPVADEPNPSLDNMYRCGFRRVCSRLNYAAPAGGADPQAFALAHMLRHR